MNHSRRDEVERFGPGHPPGDQSEVEISVTLPAFNEEGVIASTVLALDATLRRLDRAYEIIVGDDGSTDGTLQVVESLGLPEVRVVKRPHQGKGGILSDCFRRSAGAYVGFIDSDLEIDVQYLPEMVEALDEGYDGVIAIKTGESSGARRRPLRRRAGTLTYNTLVRLLFRTGVRDHQAGLKMFRRECIGPLLPSIRSRGWLWDTEILIAMTREGARIKQVPVITRSREGSKISMLGASAQMLGGVLSLWFHQSFERSGKKSRPTSDPQVPLERDPAIGPAASEVGPEPGRERDPYASDS